MSSKGKGRVIIQKNGSKIVKVLVYIPMDVAKDSIFPFLKSQTVEVEIDEGRLVIT